LTLGGNPDVINDIRGGMLVRFYQDPETSQPHIYNHGVNEEEVASVLAHSGEDRPGSEGSRIAIGKTNAGRYLRVVYVPDLNKKSVFEVTAYELKGKTLLAYRKRRRKT
jgi:uncharacterized DUF497 family protein